MTKLFTFYLVRNPFLVKFGEETQREGMKGGPYEMEREIYTLASICHKALPTHNQHE